MSENTRGAKKSGAKETFEATKKAFNDSKSNEGQSNPNGGQVDDNQEEAGSVQDTAKSSGKGKEGAKRAKNTAERGKKLFNGLKEIKSLAPLVSVISTIGIALLIIFLIIGFIGFFTTLPGLMMDKFLDFSRNFMDWLFNMDSIKIEEEQVVNLANYIESMGYGIEESGFSPVGSIKRVNGDKTEEIESIEGNYKEGNLYTYILANEKTYTVNYEAITWGDLFLPGFGSTLRNIYSNFDEYKGMIQMDDLKADIDTSIKIDRKNNKLTITQGLIYKDQMNYDLNGWTGRYGKPVELSLALHLSTMAPDFVKNFCTNKDLQTEVHISTVKRNYDVKYYFETADGTTLDKDQVNETYETLITANEVDKNYTGTEWRNAYKNGQNVSLFSENGEVNYPYVPIQMLDDLNTISFIYQNPGSTSGTETEWIGMIDSSNNAISFYDGSGKSKSFSFDISGVSANTSGKLNKTPKFTEGSSDKTDIHIIDSNVTKNSITLYELIKENFNVYFWEKGTNGNQDTFKINGIGLSMNGLINKIQSGSFSGSDEMVTKELDYLMKQIDKLVFDITQYADENDDDKGTRLKELISNFKAKHSDGYKDFSDNGGYYSSKYIGIINSQDSNSEKIEKLKQLRDECKADYKLIQEAVIIVRNDTNEKLDECGGISIETLLLLHDFFNGEADQIETYEPYINKVTHHWYRDVYFCNEDGSTDGFYNLNGGTVTKKEEYEPEGLAADDETLNKLKEDGTLYVEMKGKYIEQLKQPDLKKDEPWHHMVKNWMTSGYFFIYDGTIETAKEIESAKRFLQGKYDPKDPLLGQYSNNELLVDGDNELEEVRNIDKRAKDLNDMLEEKGYKVKLQKINFAKKSSLTAFSILESVHSEDGEYVYHDLKEFLIELGYFTRKDFEEIETGVLDWIIPEYVPDEWPNKKYEKKNDEYGTYIRSKASLDKEREEEEKKLQEISENAGEVKDEQTEVIDGGQKNSNEDENTTEETSKKIKEYKITGNTVKRTAVYEEYAESGEGYQTIITVNGITYRNYCQFAFPNIPYSEGHVNTSGCGATSVAIVLTGYGYDIGVPEVANWIRDSFHPSETAWVSLQQALEHFGGITSQVTVGSKTKESTLEYVKKIREAFDEGKPVIANVGPSYEAGDLFTGYGHYLVLLGEDENGTLLIGNPSGGYDPNAMRNKYTPGLEEFVRLFLTEQITFSSGAGGILIPDEAPTGVSFSKKLEGFEAGLEVITPGPAKVIKIEENSITLKFTEENKVKNMTMKIEGISLNPDIKEGDELEKRQPIGTTTEDDIKILMRDERKAIINNIEDYMKINKKLYRVDQPYPFTQEDLELVAKLISHEMRPSVLVSAYGMEEEEAMEAAKVCGYVLVNAALVNYSNNGTTLLDQFNAPGRYGYSGNVLGESSWVNIEITPDAMEAAEWVSKYDCSSVLNPRGEPMTRNVLSQSGWCFCNPKGTPGTTCWWWIDTSQDGQVTEANSRGDPPYDCFYCKNSDYPEK